MTKVSNEDFVVAWATSRTIDDVVKNTGMTRDAAGARGRYLRAKGVKLPKLNRPGTKLDALAVAQLNSLISKHSIHK